MKFGFTKGLLGVLVASMAVLSQTAYGANSTIGESTTIVVDPKWCKKPDQQISPNLNDKEFDSLVKDCQSILEEKKKSGECDIPVRQEIRATPVYSRSEPNVPRYAEFYGGQCRAYFTCFYQCSNLDNSAAEF